MSRTNSTSPTPGNAGGNGRVTVPSTAPDPSLVDRVKEVERVLRERFGGEAPSGRPPLECLVETILSQNTNDSLRDRAYRSLRERFPQWEDALGAGIEAIGAAIRIAGLSAQKARAIHAVLKWAGETGDGWTLRHLCDLPLDDARRRMMSVNGVGLKTASVVLCFACGRDVFPVDTHVARLTRRLGFVPERAQREAIYWAMEPLVPPGRAASFHLNLIRLGRSVCRAGNPRCPECPLNRLCPSATA